MSFSQSMIFLLTTFTSHSLHFLLAPPSSLIERFFRKSCSERRSGVEQLCLNYYQTLTDGLLFSSAVLGVFLTSPRFSWYADMVSPCWTFRGKDYFYHVTFLRSMSIWVSVFLVYINQIIPEYGIFGLVICQSRAAAVIYPKSKTILWCRHMHNCWLGLYGWDIGRDSFSSTFIADRAEGYWKYF